MEVRGTGYFYALALGRSRRSGHNYSPEETVRMVKEEIPRLALEAGLHLRADDRGGAKIMISPPLVAGPAELDDLAERLSRVLDRIAAGLTAVR